MTEETDNKKNTSGGLGKNNKPKFNIYWIYGLLALAFLSIQFLEFDQESKKTNQNEFEKMLEKNVVEHIVIIKNIEEVEVYLKPEVLSSSEEYVKYQNKQSLFGQSEPNAFFNISDVGQFEKWFNEVTKQYNSDAYISDRINRENYVQDIIGWILPIVILIAVWMFFLRRMGGGAGGPAGQIFNIGKSKAKVFDKKESQVKTNFKDVAGLEEAKIEIREIVDFLKQPKKYTELGGKIPKGALLVGPPGTGKTLLAKAVAGEAHVPFFSMSGSDFVEMFVGVGASRVRDLFKQAKEKAPCIIFIDEIDAIGRARGKNPNFGSNDERENTLNQLLTEMDGFETNTGVIILAATNRADILDKALLRAGRFDRQIHVELPELSEREEIFQVHLKPLKIDSSVDISFLAKQTPGFSGADIANVCNEAALIAARRDKAAVEKQDFLDAIDRIIGGLEKRNKIITVEEKQTIAYHEAGHATLSWLLEYAHPLIKVTIIPRGKALGAAWYLPEERQITTKEQIIDEMCATLGGRVAEELIFGKISTGAMNDLEKVTKQAYAMVTYYGMSTKVGNVCFYDSTGQSEYSFNKPYSEKTSELIDNEANDLINFAYNKAKQVLSENLDGLKKLATKLLENEVIFSEDLEVIFGKRKAKSRYDEHVNDAEIVENKQDVDLTKEDKGNS